MRITSKGQVTVPANMREMYGLRPGVEIEFLPQGDGLQIKARKPDQKSSAAFDRWLENAAGSAVKGITTEQIMTLTRGED